jgi:AbrB family looped-hinge helix DNA binding protein
MASTSVTSKGQVTIPKAVRSRLGIRAGTRVEFAVVGNRVELRVDCAPSIDVASGFGMLKSRRASLPAEFDPAALFKK